MIDGLCITDLVEHLSDETIFVDICDTYSILKLICLQTIIYDERLFSIYCSDSLKNEKVISDPEKILDYVVLQMNFKENQI